MGDEHETKTGAGACGIIGMAGKIEHLKWVRGVGSRQRWTGHILGIRRFIKKRASETESSEN